MEIRFPRLKNYHQLSQSNLEWVLFWIWGIKSSLETKVAGFFDFSEYKVLTCYYDWEENHPTKIDISAKKMFVVLQCGLSLSFAKSLASIFGSWRESSRRTVRSEDWSWQFFRFQNELQSFYNLHSASCADGLGILQIRTSTSSKNMRLFKRHGNWVYSEPWREKIGPKKHFACKSLAFEIRPTLCVWN